MNKEIQFIVNKHTTTWLMESFMVPEPFISLHFRVDIPAEFALMCYLIIADGKENIRMQRLLGYGDKNIVIGSDSMHTTAGGVAGEIKPGTYQVILGIFSEYMEQFLEDREFTVTIWISDTGEDSTEVTGEVDWIKQGYSMEQVYCEERRWYKGDFHTHTRLSDGKETVENAMIKAEQMLLDYYVPTEHNVLHTGWKKSEIMIVPGVEITTGRGHFNLFGVDRPPAKLLRILRDMNGEDVTSYMEDTIEEAKDNGWLFSVNHPFLHIWKWRLYDLPISEIKLMEIVNDPTYGYAAEANAKAIAFVDYLWQQGYHVYGIGGSDSHNLIDERYEGATEPSIAGDPGTYVYMDRLTPEHLLAGVQKGNVYVSRHMTMDIDIYCDGDTYLPGQEIVSADGLVQYAVFLHGLAVCPRVYRVINGQKEEVDVYASGRGEYTAILDFTMNLQTYNWMRTEIVEQDGSFLAYVNPIYAGKKKCDKRKTFGALVTDWEAQKND